ncbi:hypothetical protein CW354_10780 [Marinicaulis flavus]|uniref:Uncharacterized protein n=1 Tax=Hyphococcus luteus TaxID=2058213 RepID=A0A2S7K4Z2_9PROT|nr:hypothetical protein CW354_10780 [Marinicaulis flavus]
MVATALFGLIGPKITDAIPERHTAPLLVAALVLALVTGLLRFRQANQAHNSKHLQINAASQELLKHWSDHELAAYDNAPVKPVDAALQALEDFALDEKVKVFEQVAEERLRKISPARYRQLKGTNPAYFPQSVFFLRQQLGPAWRKHVGRTFIKRLLARVGIQ